MADLGLLDKIVQFMERDDFKVLNIYTNSHSYPGKRVTASVTARCGEEGVSVSGRGEFLLALIDEATTQAVRLGQWTDKEKDDESR